MNRRRYCKCKRYLATNRKSYVRLSEEDDDIGKVVKVSYVGKPFTGTHKNRKAVATQIAERIKGRKLRKDEKIVFYDRDKSHVCRSNIAVVNISDSTRYNSAVKNRSSRYKGVSWEKGRGKWYASIKVAGVSKNLGRYDNERDAALAYNKAVEALGIDVAYLNDLSKDE